MFFSLTISVATQLLCCYSTAMRKETLQCQPQPLGRLHTLQLALALTDHGEQVRMIDRSVLLVAVPQTRPVQHSGHGQTKVCSVRMNDHGGSNIVGLSQCDDDNQEVDRNWDKKCIYGPLTFNTLATKCSLMEKMVISNTVIMSSCTGLVLPRTAPKEISTVAVLKSALMILEEQVYDEIIKLDDENEILQMTANFLTS